jgi:hypothetical protein
MMVKLGLEIKETDGTINIKLVDPTKKQLDTASDNELFIAQKIKDNFEEIIKILEKKED